MDINSGMRYSVKGTHSCGKTVRINNNNNKAIDFGIKKIISHYRNNSFTML